MLNKNNIHHAYILEGNREVLYEKLCIFCEEELEFPTRANPDFWYEASDRFVISHARQLREMQLKKTKEGGRKIFVLAFNFITREAQNALLKVLEEPTQGTHIFLITPSAHVFLDTVKSRVVTISDHCEYTSKAADSFVKSSPAKRLETVAKLMSNIKKEKASKVDALMLVREIKEHLHKDFQKKPTSDLSHSIQEVGKVESYLHDASSSVKILLEHLAVSI